MGGNSTTTKENKVENRDPWSGQQPYLKDAFNSAANIYGSQINTPGYQGDFYAAPTQAMRDAFTNAMGTSADTGPLTSAIANAGGMVPTAYANSADWNNIGTGLVSQGQDFLKQGSGIIDQGSGMISQGTAGASRAMDGLYGLANSDLTGKNIENAGRYANNQYMDGMIQSALRDGQRAVTEQVLPEINRSAGGTGNYNSSRTGVAEGMVARGWSDQAADVSSTMRGNAYQQGITASQNDTNMMIQALTNSGALGNNIAQNGIGTINAGNNVAQTGNAVIGNGINAGQLGNQWANTGLAANSSVGALTGALADVNGSNLGQLAQSAAVLQGFDQGALTNAQAQQEYKDNRPWQILGNYYGITGDKSWGGTTTSSGTSTKQENPSIMSSLGSGLGLIGSLFKCDRRVKTDIVPVGTLPDGITLYTFRYIGDESQKLHTAPMAQDVQEKYPEAIIEIDGVLHIDTNHYDWR